MRRKVKRLALMLTVVHYGACPSDCIRGPQRKYTISQDIPSVVMAFVYGNEACYKCIYYKDPKRTRTVLAHARKT